MFVGIVIWSLLASLVTMGLYAWDKRAATNDHTRISERTLLIWSLVGGWPGGLLGSRWFHHKTRKVSYQVKFAGCVILNLVVALGLFFWSIWG